MWTVKRSDLNRLKAEQEKMGPRRFNDLGYEIDDRHFSNYYHNLPEDLKKILVGFPAQVIAHGVEAIEGWLKSCRGMVDEDA